MNMPRILRTPFLSMTRLYQRLRSNRVPVDVTVADWDTLVILDACRYDTFKSLSDLSGTLRPRRSMGSATDEFLSKTFDDESYHDIVYVTANPRVSILLSTSFHDMIEVWRDNWDQNLETVPPDAIAEATVSAQEKYPNKRIVSHFIQPHAPFIGESASEQLADHSTLRDHHPDLDTKPAGTENVWTRVRNGDLDEAIVKRAYEENLELALPHVKRIMQAESGKTVVTSDHGNLFGERVPPFMRRFYGHPTGLHAEPLVRVPWLEHDNGNRRRIVAETAGDENHDHNESYDNVESKLRDLGYA